MNTKQMSIPRHKHVWRNRRARRRGVSIVLVALAMTALLGFCALSVDYGFLTKDANQLQRGCDAAALAGAPYLKRTGSDATDTAAASQAAIYVAYQNGLTITSSNVTFLNNNTQIKVQASQTQAFLFGRALGMSSSKVTRDAVAGINAITAADTSGVVPMGVTSDTENAYKYDWTHDYTITLIRGNTQPFIRDTTTNPVTDDMILFDLGGGNGKSPAHMQNQTAGTEIVPTTIGNDETTLNASNTSETLHMERGLASRFTAAALPPYSDPTGSKADQIVAGTADISNPRVVSIIVTNSNPNPSGGTTQLPILDFQPIYLESYTEIGNATTLKVRFLPPLNSSSGDHTITSGSPTGIRQIQLMG